MTHRTPPELQALINTCKAIPDDDFPRLVLADWLEDLGDSRAEFIRIQIKRGQLPSWDLRQAGLARREAVLLQWHGAEWLGPLARHSKESRFRRGFIELNLVDGSQPGQTDIVNCPEWMWVEGLTLFRPSVLKTALEQFVGEGIVSLDLNNPRDADTRCQTISRAPQLATVAALTLRTLRQTQKDLADFGKSPHLGRLTSFGLYDVSDNTIRTFACPNLQKVRRFELINTSLTAKGIAELDAVDLTSLTHLDISGAELGVAGASRLANAAFASRLESLSLGATKLGPAGVRALFESTRFTELTKLKISSEEEITADSVEALARSSHFPKLRSLSFEHCKFTLDAVKSLAASPLLKQVERLALQFAGLCGEGFASIVQSPYLTSLRDLDLSWNSDAKDALGAFAQSKIKNLNSLNLDSMHSKTDRYRELAGWLANQQFVQLNLGATGLGDEGCRVLADCPGLENLIELHLSGDATPDDSLRVIFRSAWLPGVVNLGVGRLGKEGLKELLAVPFESLASLNLNGCFVGDEGAKLLAGWPGLAGLSELPLMMNQITDDGAAALVESPYLNPMLRLNTSMNSFSDEMNARFRERLGMRFTASIDFSPIDWN
jgi:uncharacterized protein (TIGR02996 family)